MRFNKILVTGAAGFIGFSVCKELLEQGYDVIGIDNINDYYEVDLKCNRLKELGINRNSAEEWQNKSQSSIYEKLSFVRVDIEDRDYLPALFQEEKFDAVIHLAAQAGVRYSLENPEAYIDSNIVGFLNVLQCCRLHHIQHLVYASSSSVYGENDRVPFTETDQVDHPVSLYAATKKANELMAHTYSHLYGFPTTGLRFFTVYGPWGRPDMAPMLFSKAIIEGRAIKVFNEGNMSRDFTFIDDITNGIIIAMNEPSRTKVPYQLLNIGNGEPVNLLDFINTLEDALGIPVEKSMLPMQPGDVPRTWANIDKLKHLGYQSTTDIRVGIEIFVKWYKNYYNIV